MSTELKIAELEARVIACEKHIQSIAKSALDISNGLHALQDRVGKIAEKANNNHLNQEKWGMAPHYSTGISADDAAKQDSGEG